MIAAITALSAPEMSVQVRMMARVGSTTCLNRAGLTAILDRQLDVITRGQAQKTGLTDSALRHRLRPGGPWRVLLPTVYIAATGLPSMAQQQVAAQLYGGTRRV